MRLSVNAMRVLLLALNVLFASGFAIHYGYEMLGREEGLDNVNIRSPAEFKPTSVDLPPPPSPTEMVAVDNWLNPPTAVATTAKATEGEGPKNPDPVEAAPPVPGELPDGPLAKDWDYTWAFIYKYDAKLQSKIRLERKEEAKVAGAGGVNARATAASSRIRQLQSSRGVRRPPLGQPQVNPGDRVEFLLADRHFQDETLQLDFFMEGVDEERFVYWVPATPGTLYSLKRKRKGDYYQLASAKGLLNLEKEADADGGEGDKETERRIVEVPPNLEDRVEADYARIRRGEKGLGDLKPKKGAAPAKTAFVPPGLQPPRPAVPTPGAVGAVAVPTGSGEAVAQPNAGAGQPVAGPAPPMSDAEAAKQMGSAIRDARQSGKLSDKDRKDLDELETMIKGPRSK